MSTDTVLESVVAYYAEKLSQHGPVPRGVDWKNSESQELRFHQLIRLWNLKSDSTILDFGCGYGALLDFLRNQKNDCHYVGYDAAIEMITAGRNAHSEDKNSVFENERASLKPAHYAAASGLFNVRCGFSDSQFEEFVLRTLHEIDELSERGFSFNMLTKYSDSHLMREDLYYADPAFFFDYCKKNFSRKVALLHDYELFEFTIVVSKSASRDK